MLVAVCADIHSPRFLEQFSASLKAVGKIDLMLLAGDIVLKNDFSQLPILVKVIREVYNGPILACFGNEEYEQDKEKYKECQEIKWLEDEVEVIQADESELGIVGSRGSLDRPTFWQRRNLPGIWQVYEERVRKIDELLANLKTRTKIVLTHYAPTYRTLEGEKESAWPEMGCKKLEEVILRRQPDFWIHGHAHNGRVPQIELGRTLIVNASLPARGSVVTFEIPRKSGLYRFIP
jgi:Icc-related predicted phosphoesterase